MSAAAAEPVVVDGNAPPVAKKGRKKLIMIAAVALLVLAAGGGGGAYFVVKKRAAAAALETVDAEGGEAVAAAPTNHVDRKKTPPPVFLPLDPFIVNLADRESERFAQIGITLELDDAHFADELKAYMPAIRNGVLMVLAHKTSQQLLSRKGKEALAAEVMREAVRPLGIEIDEDAGHTGDKGGDDAAAKAAPKGGDHNPVRHVHFSSFIIQ